VSTKKNKRSLKNENLAKKYLMGAFKKSQKTKEDFIAKNADQLINASRSLYTVIKNEGKILICGNGGSAADAQHMAAELVGRMLIERRALPAVALTTDSSNLTAIGNDYGYDFVFSRQVEALGDFNDILVAISTSGNSRNVIKAIDAARAKGMKVICITGGRGGEMAEMNRRYAIDHFLCASKGKTSSEIQETHIFIIHSLVDIMDRFFLNEN
jgi:D-sedoheptulose 7-phosphate isomerase